MTDFEIEKGMITGMVKSTFKGVRVVSAGCDDGSVEMAFDNGLAVDPVLADDRAYFSIGVVTCRLR